MDQCGLYIKYTIFTLEFILFAVSCAAFGGAVWVLVSENIWIEMMDSRLLDQAALILVVATIAAVLVSVIAMWGTLVESKWTMIFSTIASVLIFALMVTVGVLGAVSQSEYPQDLQNKMRESISKYYGVRLHDPYNQEITNTWDQLQTEEECCGVEDQSWSVYSNWAELQVGVIRGDRPYVPETCCLRDQYDRYINLQNCQTASSGPPSQQSSTHNSDLIYRGCYSVVLTLLRNKAQYIMGIGFTTAFYMIPVTGLMGGVACRMP